MEQKEANPMEKYYAKDRAEAGIQLPLTDVVGRETGDWIQIRGTDSEEFTLANAAAMRLAVEINAMTDLPARDKKTLIMTRDLVSVLVMDWSFPLECTKENVVSFLERAPQIQRQIDLASNSRALFWTVESGNSVNTEKLNSGSTLNRKAASKRSARR